MLLLTFKIKQMNAYVTFGLLQMLISVNFGKVSNKEEIRFSSSQFPKSHSGHQRCVEMYYTVCYKCPLNNGDSSPAAIK